MRELLKNKNAVITGARRGIGKATVEVFASQGANIWACARKKDDGFESEMARIAECYGVSIWPLYFDITDEEKISAAVREIKSQKLDVDILVNAAGVTEESTSFQMTSLDKMKHVMDVNFFGNTLLTQYISRLMIRQKSGSIVNVASVAGIDGTPAQYEYVASKAAVIGATKSLAREMAKYNIRVNAIAPGIIDTDMGAMISPDLKESTISKVMMNRIGKPGEVAEVIAFLGSEMANYMTGQIIRVDGGM